MHYFKHRFQLCFENGGQQLDKTIFNTKTIIFSKGNQMHYTVVVKPHIENPS